MEDVTALEDLLDKAGQPDRQATGPGDAVPNSNTDRSELVTLPMTEEEVTGWWKEIGRADSRTEERAKGWDILMKEYIPTVSPSGTPEALKVNIHFRNVHTKLPQLFYRSPDLVLEPDDPSPAQDEMPNPMQEFAPEGVMLPALTREDIISVKQAILKKKLGRDGIKANRLMDEMLFDCLAWSGIAFCKVGYRCTSIPTQEPVMVPDPNHIPDPMADPNIPPPQVQQMGPDGKPAFNTTMVPIHEDYYARRIPPKKGIMDAALRSTRIDEDATYMGMHFYLTARQGQKQFKLSADDIAKATEDNKTFQYSEDANARGDKLLHFVELYVKASYYTDEPHPEAMNQLILLEGKQDGPVVWRPSPDQEFDEGHRLTADSFTGFPVQVLAIRDLADSPYPQADAAFVNSGAKELSTFRRQGIALRNAAIGKYLYDSAIFESNEDVEKLKNGQVGECIPVRDGALANGGDKVFTTTAQVRGTVDDYNNQEILKRDINETIGIDAPQAGVQNESARTATETATAAQGAASRNTKERDRVIDFYLDIVRKVDQLLMRYMDQEQYIQVVGIEGANRIMMWNGQTISGKYLYDIAPDSQAGPDTAVDFKNLLDLYNLAAADPLFNRAYVLRRLARMKGMDPSKVVLNPQQQMLQPQHGGRSGPVDEHENGKSGKRQNEPGAENHRGNTP